MNDATVKAIRKLKDGNGQYIWQPLITVGAPDTILNRSVKTSDCIPTLGAGAKSRYVWLLKGKFKLSSDECNTEAEKPNPKRTKLSGEFYARDFDGNYRFIVDEDGSGIDASIVNGWFTEVPDKPIIPG